MGRGVPGRLPQGAACRSLARGPLGAAPSRGARAYPRRALHNRRHRRAVRRRNTREAAARSPRPAESVRGVVEALDGDGLRDLGARAEDAEERVSLAEATLCAPIPDARKIICVGLNYRDHAKETGQEIPAAPMWFAKFANSLN